MFSLAKRKRENLCRHEMLLRQLLDLNLRVYSSTVSQPTFHARDIFRDIECLSLSLDLDLDLQT